MALRFPYRLAAAACLGLSTFAVAADKKVAPVAATAAHADQQLADAIANKLAQAPGLSRYQVDVLCQSGAVELTGSVRNDEQRAEVNKLVRGTKGVKKIVDKMSLSGSDIQAAQAVESVPGPIGGSLPPGATPLPQGNLPPFQGQLVPGGPMGSAAPIPYGMNQPGPGSYGTDPTPVGLPPTGGLYDGVPPKMPPHAWPTYAPYNNYSRVGYPTEYPQNAFPFIGPFYPFPKVPLGFRAIKLEWEDGHWYYGRTATMRDHWKVRYW